jgi:hypothetical protein
LSAPFEEAWGSEAQALHRSASKNDSRVRERDPLRNIYGPSWPIRSKTSAKCAFVPITVACEDQMGASIGRKESSTE